MIIIKTSKGIQYYCQKQKKAVRKTGFVPTMGALHQGHLNLIDQALKTDDLVICSIFVNPTQFNNKEDLKHYPSSIEQDIQLLEEKGCHVLFLPSIEEVYPAQFETKVYPIGELESILEGEYRPGHFQGVCQVMDQLLSFVQPDDLFLGQKDFQQCMVIKKLLSILNLDKKINLHIIPTVRESDGLAMSSRNLRLNDKQRQLAPLLFKQLNSIKSNLNNIGSDDVFKSAKKELEKNGFKVDYLKIVRTSDLHESTDPSNKLVVVVAAYLDSIRLIDNLILN